MFVFSGSAIVLYFVDIWEGGSRITVLQCDLVRSVVRYCGYGRV